MPFTTRAAGFAIAAIAVTTPAPALAGNAVYGGSTSAGAAIVINADKKAKKLRSMVVSWRAELRRRHAASPSPCRWRPWSPNPASRPVGRARDHAQREGPLRRHPARRLRLGDAGGDR